MDKEVCKCVRSCNLHHDCDEAARKAKEEGRRDPYHCHHDDCEDCFGC